MEVASLPTDEAALQNILNKKSFAYKVIYVENGLIVLFDRLRRFKEDSIRIRITSGDLILELGNNVMLLTEDMIKHLIATKNLFLYQTTPNGYEAKKEELAFTAEPALIARIQGAWEVLKNHT